MFYTCKHNHFYSRSWYSTPITPCKHCKHWPSMFCSLVSFEERREKILSVSRSQSMSSCRLASTALKQEKRRKQYFKILYRQHISCRGGGDDVGRDSRSAGLAACCVVTLVFATLPGSTGVIGWMVGGEAPLVAAADLTQDLQPFTGLHAVSRLHIQRLLRVDHLKHLTQDKQSALGGLPVIIISQVISRTLSKSCSFMSQTGWSMTAMTADLRFV